MPILSLSSIDARPIVINDALRYSIEQDGIIEPILVDAYVRTNGTGSHRTSETRYRVIDGNQRVAILREMGGTQIDAETQPAGEVARRLAPRDNLVRLLSLIARDDLSDRGAISAAAGWTALETRCWEVIARHELFPLAEARIITVDTLQWMIEKEGEQGALRPSEISILLATLAAWRASIELEPLTLRTIKRMYARTTRLQRRADEALQTTIEGTETIPQATWRPPILVEDGVLDLVRNGAGWRARTRTNDDGGDSAGVGLSRVNLFNPISNVFENLFDVLSRRPSMPQQAAVIQTPMTPTDLLRQTAEALTLDPTRREVINARERFVPIINSPITPDILPTTGSFNGWQMAADHLTQMLSQLPVSPSQLHDEAMTALEDALALAQQIAAIGGRVTDASPDAVDAPVARPRRRRNRPTPTAAAGTETEAGEEATVAPRPINAPPLARVLAEPFLAPPTRSTRPRRARSVGDLAPDDHGRIEEIVFTTTPMPMTSGDAATFTGRVNIGGVNAASIGGALDANGWVRAPASASPFDSSADEIRARLVNNATGLRINGADHVNGDTPAPAGNIDPVARRIAQHRANAGRR
jgi:hypothetical protein